MKKFERLPPEKRKEEIRTAAAALFAEKGFSAVTMEDIVARVSLSKGGVYRIYPSPADILGDLMLDGMRLRNAFYAEKVRALAAAGEKITTDRMIGILCDSLLLYPEISSVYVEFLWEKRRNPKLEALYQRVCAESIAETRALIAELGEEADFDAENLPLAPLTDWMNAAILSIHVLNLQQDFRMNREMLTAAAEAVLTGGLSAKDGQNEKGE